VPAGDGRGLRHADIEINGHRETWPVGHKRFRLWLELEFYRATGGAPTGNAMTTALDHAEAVATHDAPVGKVFLRCTRHDVGPAKSHGWSRHDAPAIGIDLDGTPLLVGKVEIDFAVDLAVPGGP
jgi:hypothetical protein